MLKVAQNTLIPTEPPSHLLSSPHPCVNNRNADGHGSNIHTESSSIFSYNDQLVTEREKLHGRQPQAQQLAKLHAPILPKSRKRTGRRTSERELAATHAAMHAQFVYRIMIDEERIPEKTKPGEEAESHGLVPTRLAACRSAAAIVAPLCSQTQQPHGDPRA